MERGDQSWTSRQRTGLFSTTEGSGSARALRRARGRGRRRRAGEAAPPRMLTLFWRSYKKAAHTQVPRERERAAAVGAGRGRVLRKERRSSTYLCKSCIESDSRLQYPWYQHIFVQVLNCFVGGVLPAKQVLGRLHLRWQRNISIARVRSVASRLLGVGFDSLVGGR